MDLRKYYIMNKDIIVLEFGVDEYNNIVPLHIVRKDILPAGIKNRIPLLSWIQERIAISHRTDILRHFKELGIDHIADIVEITKCVSLNDTFWVKSAESKIHWELVSPYTNPLNSEIARYSFDGAGKINKKLISHSPDFATSGNYPKCWRRENEKIYLYKAGTSLYSNAGQEPYSEYLASTLAEYLDFNSVRYELTNYRNKTATKCECMCTEATGLYSLASYSPEVSTYDSLLSDSRFSNSRKQIIDMLLLDYLTMNTDRHLNNIGILVNNDNQSYISVSPIYDNNLSLLPYYKPSHTDAISHEIETYIEENSEHIVASDGRTFDDLYRLIKSDDTERKIKQASDFRFDASIPRADIAQAILQRQIRRAMKL